MRTPAVTSINQPAMCWTKVDLVLRARVIALDGDGRADGRSVRTIITHVAPRHLVLLHGAPPAVAALRDHCATELRAVHTQARPDYRPAARPQVRPCSDPSACSRVRARVVLTYVQDPHYLYSNGLRSKALVLKTRSGLYFALFLNLVSLCSLPIRTISSASLAVQASATPCAGAHAGRRRDGGPLVRVVLIPRGTVGRRDGRRRAAAHWRLPARLAGRHCGTGFSGRSLGFLSMSCMYGLPRYAEVQDIRLYAKHQIHINVVTRAAINDGQL